jgi:hypothetical protein
MPIHVPNGRNADLQRYRLLAVVDAQIKNAYVNFAR